MALILTFAVVAFLRRRRAAANAQSGPQLSLVAGGGPGGDVGGGDGGAENAENSGLAAASAGHSASPGLHALAGALGGVISFSLTYPLATIATRLQVQEKFRKADDDGADDGDGDNNASISGAGSRDRPQHYTGALDCFQRMVKEEGAMSLYAGLSSGIFGVAASQFVFYFFYNLIRQRYSRLYAGGREQLSTAANLLLSALAGAMTATLTNPIWVVNTRLQVSRNAQKQGAPAVLKHAQDKKAQASMLQSMTGQQTQQVNAAAESDGLDSSVLADEEAGGSQTLGQRAEAPSVLHTILEIFREEGVPGFFRGITPALILVANPTIQYAAFERLKSTVLGMRRRQARKGGVEELTSLQVFWLGIVAKAIATVITYPYIIAKSVQHTQASSAGGSGQSEPTLVLLQRVFKDEGPLGLFRGLKSKIVQSTLTAGILFLTKEEITNALIRLTAN